MDGSELYIDLLKRVLANDQSPGMGLRVRYLLDCVAPTLLRPTRLENTPVGQDGRPRLDIEYFRTIEEHEPEAVVGVRTDPGGKYWWEAQLGFPFTMVSRERLDNVEWAVRTVIAERIPGDFLEAGVWRGGVGILMRALTKVLGQDERTVWMADSFEGLPLPTADADLGLRLDLNWMLPASLAEVKANFEGFGLLDEHVRFIEGWFADTMPSAPVERLSVLRLDGDYYSSTMEVLEPMYSRVSPGGFVIVDDYGYHEGCRRAVHEFLDGRELSPVIVPIDDVGVYWRTPLTE